MQEYVGVGDIAREYRVRPSQITQLFSERRLREDLCPVVSGRRLIPRSYVPMIVMALKRKGISVDTTSPASSDASRAARGGADRG